MWSPSGAAIGAQTEKPAERALPAGQTKTLSAALPRFSYFMQTHLLFSTGFKAPNALGSPQYLAPVAHTMR